MGTSRRSNFKNIIPRVSRQLWALNFKLIYWCFCGRNNRIIFLFDDNVLLDNKSSFDYYLSKNTDESVNITSPGYPYGYSPNLNVTWTIHTDSYHHIEVEFDDVNLSPTQSHSENSVGDYVIVETGKGHVVFQIIFIINSVARCIVEQLIQIC